MAQQFDDALHLMEVQGGSFVKALAHLYRMADPVNKSIAREAFSKYFETYEARFLEHHARTYVAQDNAQHEGSAA